jgi:hypothetical protein
MAKISFTKEELFRPRDFERYELLLFRGELLAEGMNLTWHPRPDGEKVAVVSRNSKVEYMLPIIDKRLREIEEERNRLGLSRLDPAEYADAVRDSEMEMAGIVAQLKQDQADRI